MKDGWKMEHESESREGKRKGARAHTHAQKKGERVEWKKRMLAYVSVL